MGCLLIVMLIKFTQIKRQPLSGPNPITAGAYRNTQLKTEWLMNWKKADMQFLKSAAVFYTVDNIDDINIGVFTFIIWIVFYKM